jgi:hypothetical protein
MKEKIWGEMIMTVSEEDKNYYSDLLEETENMNYTESMIYYANKYMFMSDDPTSTRVKDMDISEFIVQKP